MGGGNGVAVPRLSKRFNVGIIGVEPSLNVASYPGKGKSPVAQHGFNHLFSTETITPVPLRVIPAGKAPEGFILPTMRFDPRKESSCPNGSCDSYSNAASDLQMVPCPFEHDRYMEHDFASMVGYSAPGTKGESANIVKNGKRIHTQNLADVTETRSKSRLQIREANARSVREKLRRDRIQEGIKVLKYSVPCSGSSDKADGTDVVDDAIDYIKYLKLQLKLLSQSRLGGESAPFPFVHLEGYGHYLLHQRVSNEPLEDIMGELYEKNPQAANELLESKGLTILPMDFAYTLLRNVYEVAPSKSLMSGH